MNRSHVCVLALAAIGAGAQAQVNQVYNGSFEILDDFGEVEGWGLFNTARFVETGDPGALIRTGERSLELPSGADFAGATTNVLNPDTLEFYDPKYIWRGGPVRVSGWYAIPADQPLDGANAGMKLEFRRDDFSIYIPIEDLVINGHTNGEWVEASITVGCDEISDEWPPYPTTVSVLPIRFGSSNSTGTIFWDDIFFTQCLADMNCDNTIDTRDVLQFLNLWNAQDDRADFDGNGSIDTRDVLAFLNTWNQPCP
jgi:hypothetical protein